MYVSANECMDGCVYAGKCGCVDVCVCMGVCRYVCIYRRLRGRFGVHKGLPGGPRGATEGSLGGTQGGPLGGPFWGCPGWRSYGRRGSTVDFAPFPRGRVGLGYLRFNPTRTTGSADICMYVM